MQLSESVSKAAIVVLVIAVLGIGYLLWTRSAPPEAAPLPGQSILAPMGLNPRGPGRGQPGTPAQGGRNIPDPSSPPMRFQGIR